MQFIFPLCRGRVHGFLGRVWNANSGIRLPGFHKRADFLHPLALRHPERAAVVAVAAPDAVGSVLLQRLVMLHRQPVTGLCQIVILVYQADIDSRGAGLAMVAVHAFSTGLGGAKEPTME